MKPENVLLDPQFHAKINDFGTAKVIGQTRNGKEITKKKKKNEAANNSPLLLLPARSHSFTGTAEYVSPELLSDKSSGKA
jgi:3-phosphoinositide dependent protein kinase-1